MPATQTPVFRHPEDPDTPIWRYMDFTKFVSMLEDGGLFFCRADRLGDKFEGSYPIALLAARAEIETLYPVLATMNAEALHRFDAKWMMISCWHMNLQESAAMWKIYTMTRESIAIRSTFAKLRDSLDEKYYIGQVTYIDYATDAFPDGNGFYPFLHKRQAFAHENEVRAITPQHLIRYDELAQSANRNADKWSLADSTIEPPAGILKQVNLHELIDAVYVSPDSPQWFKTLVEKVLLKYSFKIGVTPSSLDDSPNF